MGRKAFQVEGMSCGHFEMSVREALEELDGVESARADRATGAVELSYDAARVKDEDLWRAVEGAGYTPRPL